MLRKVHLYRFTLPKYTKSGRYRPLTNKLHQINEDGKYFIYNELESGGKKRAKRNSITLADAQCLLWWSVSYVRETWLLRFKPPKMAFPSLCCLFRAIYQKLNNMLWIYRREYLLSLRFLTARRKLRFHNSTKTR